METRAVGETLTMGDMAARYLESTAAPELVHAEPWQPSYAHPWPDRVPACAGPRSVGPFAPCSACGTGSWVRYGAEVLCHACTITRAMGRAAESAADDNVVGE